MNLEKSRIIETVYFLKGTECEEKDEKKCHGWSWVWMGQFCLGGDI